MRRRPEPIPPGPEVPDHLRRYIVEDWVEPTEMPRWVDKEINALPTGVEEVTWSLMLLARRRHQDAVAEWVAHGGARPFSGRPVFRDEAAFMARIPNPEWSRR